MESIVPRMKFVVAIVLVLTACREKRTVALGESCTGPYASETPERVCAPGQSCLLMMKAKAYTCVLPCKTGADCTRLGKNAVCEHANTHADARGCVDRPEVNIPPM